MAELTDHGRRLLAEAAVAQERWWHVYGGIANDDTWGDNVWALFILGESTMHPEELVAKGKLEINTGMTVYPYLRSYNHDPSDAEKLLLTPEEYRD